MPDRYGFNHLGDDVRCIDCPAGGPIGGWPEHLRVQHARIHGRTTSDLRRQRLLLAVSPPTQNEEKEATMPTTTSNQTSAKQVAIDVLHEAGEPLHASEIAKRVLASGRCAGLKGKTPEATISAMLAVGSKPGGPFARIAKGTYTLADPRPPGRPLGATGESAPPEQATARKTAAAAAKTKSNAKARTRRSGKHAH